MDWRFAAMSGQCAQAVKLGQELKLLHGKLSVLLIREDGVDQAKFKCPRKLVKGHLWDKLYRPALHVHGVWAHGFGFHFAVSDADMPKGTNSNVEIFANMLESIYKTSGNSLPKTLMWIQDNTSRECKNSKIVKFCIMLVLLDIFKDVYLAYPAKGHTHGPLDATFGQCCVKLSNTEFDTPLEVVDVLQQFLDGSRFEHLADENKKAYKLDEAAHWEQWWNQVPLVMSDLTGPEAPHLFHLCSRCDLGLDDVQGVNTKWPGAPPADPMDLVMSVKSRMSSVSAHQVALILPASEVKSLCQTVSKQPVGVFPRRHVSDKLRGDIVRNAETVFQHGTLSEPAFRYLEGWAKSTARRKPRPHTYTFLNHRTRAANLSPAQPIPSGGFASKPRPVTVLYSGDLSHAVGQIQSIDEEILQDEEPPLVFYGGNACT